MPETAPKRAFRTVRKRRVFYIPGYDPIPPRRYRELYRKEAAAQALISGYEIALRPKQRQGNFGWSVTAKIEGVATESDVEVLVWSDIVRDSMDVGILATYQQLVRTAWCYIQSGALWRLMRLRKGPVIAALYPVLFLLVQLILSLFAAYGMGWLIALVLPWWVGLAALAVVPMLLGWFKKQDSKFFAYYLMHDYAYSASTRGANPPELDARLQEFTEAISKALRSDVDEVLVVGHSSGAHLAVSVLAELIRSGKTSPKGPQLSFLSLGQVVPMVSFLPEAHRLRADLRYLCQREELDWVDVTAPGDGCAFALCDPVSVSGVAPNQGKLWPLVLSAAFTQTLSPERWQELRWRFFRLHFQYLCAFDRPGAYDYFQITAGPRTLGARFEGRAPSASRIETPVNKFTSVSP
ncbi:hypothetical protein [Cognatishimia maritima]|uniref:Alpha/beta hydrolase family protein n=1 Tax=Cognatishimia maritima TaxID=870908 RepID=A0A1M5ID30_9RHOB|nr:hypothetical protein [Cognatishimia maritima]SHG25810.1 hypothetical protein SAMN04488044_0277 [Cognatishimia maritima]